MKLKAAALPLCAFRISKHLHPYGASALWTSGVYPSSRLSGFSVLVFVFHIACFYVSSCFFSAFKLLCVLN
jgi:hypothetical protein